MIYEDIRRRGNSLEVIASYVDVSAATMRRYVRLGKAPRSISVALYWQSIYGINQHDVEVANALAMQQQKILWLQQQNEFLRCELDTRDGIDEAIASQGFEVPLPINASYYDLRNIRGTSYKTAIAAARADRR